jgi:4-amino-4-deoxychorismate lyase
MVGTVTDHVASTDQLASTAETGPRRGAGQTVAPHRAPLVALLDGSIRDPGEPLLRPDDLGVLRGEGVFETTLVVDGEPRDLSDHLVRLAVSAEMTGMVVPPPDAWRRAVNALVSTWSGGRQMVMRLVASRGPEAATEPVCYVLGSELSPASIRQRTEGVRVLLLDRGFTAQAAKLAPWLLAGAKTLSYGVNMAALRYAVANNADDVIFVGSDGGVLEAPTATVVLARGRSLLTPPLDGILDGITVRRLFRAARAAGWTTRTTHLTADQLRSAEGVWLASSARLLAPVVAIDGVALPGTGPTAELAALLDIPV